MNDPLVSILMPAYNAEKYIAKAIESVFDQSYSNWELIIINDASKDDTGKIIENYANDHRIKYILNKTNSGKPSMAKNIGLKIAQGEYIAFLDSDDMWLPNKLELQVKKIVSGDFALCYSGGYWIDSMDTIINTFVPQYPDGQNLKNMLFRYELNNQTVLLSKKALENTQKEFNENIIIGEDYNLFMHIIAKYNICSLSQPLVKYRIHDLSITKSKKRVSDGVLITLNELNDLYNIKYKFPIQYLLSYLKAVRFKYLKKR